MAVTGAEVVVVGGGLVGATVGYELARRGVEVAVVDAAHPGRATDAGAGILSPETTQHPHPGFYPAAQRAAAFHRELAGRLAEDGVADTGHHPSGLLWVATRPGEDDWFARTAPRLLERAPEALRPVTPEEAAEAVPALAPVRAALHNRAAWRVDGRVLLAGVRQAGARRGVRAVAGTALGLEAAGGRVRGVRLAEGTLACDQVVVAAGAWSAPLLAPLGVSLPVTATKGQIVHLVRPDARGATWPIVQPLMSYYLVAWPGGRVACGGTLEPEAGFDVRPTADGVAQLLREALLVAPGLAQATVVETRVGLRPSCADDLPAVGRLPGWDNAWVAAGHGTDGLLLGPHAAALVADAVAEGSAPAHLALFDPARFDA